MGTAEVRAPLGERMAGLAIQLSDQAFETNNALLQDAAATVSEFAQQLEEEYTRLTDAGANGVTNAQAITLGRKILPGDVTNVTVGGAGLSNEYLHVSYLHDRFELGIDREGRASS